MIVKGNGGMNRVARGVATVLLYTMPLSACYAYGAVPPTTPLAEGTEVRAFLSEPRSLDLGSMTVNDINRLEGNVYRVDDDSLSMWTSWVYTQFGNRFAANGSVYYVPRDDIAQLEQRKIQIGGTIFLIGAVIGGVVGLLAIANSSGSGGMGGDGGGELPRIVKPVNW